MKYLNAFLFTFISLIIISCSKNSVPVDSRPDAQLTGTVSDFFQAPLKDVKIYTDPVSENVTTDQNGHFIISKINTGSYKVYAEKNGYRTEVSNVLLKEKEVTDLSVILRWLVSVSGKVVDDESGQGIGNVKIVIDKYNSSVFTNNDGTFQLNNIAIGTSAATFTVPGFCLKLENIFIDLNKSTGYEYRLIKLTPVEMIAVKGGSFQMGDGFGDGFINEKPVHTVTLSDFMISKYEVTQKEWTQIIGTDPAKFWGEKNPVESVSWNDAVNYCNSRSVLEGLNTCYKTVNGIVTCDFNANGYRLPTEAEWEYAARGGNLSKNTKYSGGPDLKEVGWFYTYSENITHNVGTKLPNELGIYDMSGNVWELCWDYFDANYYSSSAQLNPTGPAQGQTRVSRGGSWTDDQIFNRVFYRNFTSQFARATNVGFRVVRNSK